jgi:hypothetical protein
MSVLVPVSVSQENAVLELAQRSANQAIRACALHYGFSADEALELLDLSMVRSAEKVVAKKSKSKSKSNKSVVVAMPKLPIPFSGELIERNCHGLKHNHGLFTQCNSQLDESKDESKEESKLLLLCASCCKQASKNSSGNPDCGRIESRLSVDLFDFRDPKGRKPVALTTVMKKMNLSRNQIETEAAQFNIIINPIHFEIPKANKANKANTEEPIAAAEEPVATVAAVSAAGGCSDSTPRGRPKKASKTPVVDATEDLFATLVSQAAVPLAAETVVAVAAVVEEIKPEKKKSAPKKVSEEAKAAKAALALAKAEKEAALALAKAEKEAALALAKAEKEAKKNALALAKVEKEATKNSLALAKAEKEATKNALALAKAEKEAKKPTKKAVVPVPVIVATAVDDNEESEEEYESAAEEDDEENDSSSPPIDVEEFVHKGTTYLKTGENVIYSQDQELVGHWNEETQEIDICDESESEEEEEEEEEEDA